MILSAYWTTPIITEMLKRKAEQDADDSDTDQSAPDIEGGPERRLMTLNDLLFGSQIFKGHSGSISYRRLSEHLAEPGPAACPSSARHRASFYRKMI